MTGTSPWPDHRFSFLSMPYTIPCRPPIRARRNAQQVLKQDTDKVGTLTYASGSGARHFTSRADREVSRING